MNEINPDILALIQTYGLKVVGVVIFLFAVYLFAGWCRKLVQKATKSAAVDRTLSHFFGNAVRWLIILLGLLACLSVFGIQTTSFAAILGAAGLAIGLAFQGTLSNLAAGVMLLVFRPFKVGSFISVGGATGTVREIDLFTVSMDTLDNRRLILPNSSIFGAAIENLSFNESRRVDVPVGVCYGADMDQTREVLMNAAKTVPHQSEGRAPEIFLAGLGASSVDWEVRVWCAHPDYFPVWDATVRAAKKALDEAGISIPFPQMDVHLDGNLKRD